MMDDMVERNSDRLYDENFLKEIHDKVIDKTVDKVVENMMDEWVERYTNKCYSKFFKEFSEKHVPESPSLSSVSATSDSSVEVVEE